MFVPRTDPTVAKILAAAGVKGRKDPEIKPWASSRDLDSYWSGGSRDYFTFVSLRDFRAIQVATNHPYFERNRPRHLTSLPDGVVLVEVSIYRGQHMAPIIWVPPENIGKLLPAGATDTLSEDQLLVLLYTRSYKSSYGGRSNLRFELAHEEKGISRASWEKAKSDLIQSGHLRSNGSITSAGRNAVEQYPAPRSYTALDGTYRGA